MSSKKSGAYYNDHDKDVCAVLRELIKRGLIPDGEVDERSILDVQPVDLAGFIQCHFFAGIGGWGYALRLAGWPDDKPVWTGSPPCQPFSVAGKGLAADDPRHLGPAFVRLVRASRPGVLFGEQVASADVFGHVAGGSKRGATGQPKWTWIDDLFLRLEAARYAAWAVDYPSASIGAPHIRQRTYFGAVGMADAERDRDTARAQPSAPHHREEGSRGRIGDEPCDGSSGIDRLGDAASRELGEFGDAAQPGRGRHADGAGGASGGVAHSFGEGLEGLGGDGHDRHEPGRQRADAPRSVAARGDTGRLADLHSHGCDEAGCDQPSARNDGAERNRAPGGLADAYGRNPGAERQQRGGEHGFEQADGGAEWLADAMRERQFPGAQRGIHRGEEGAGARHGEPERCGAVFDAEPATGPTYGPWGNADWLYSRDERWRPAFPGHVGVVDGLPDFMVRGSIRSNSGQEEKEEMSGENGVTKPAEVLPSMRGPDGAQAVQVRAGGHDGLSAARLLQPGLHGKRNDKGSVHEYQSQQAQGIQNGENGVRSVRQDGKASRSPHGRGPFQQLPIELEDFVRFLPRQITLAKLHGRWRDAKALQALQQAICKGRSMPVTSEQAFEAWGRLGREDQDRIRVAFGPIWVARQFSPLSQGEPARASRLRGYGNAINPWQAAHFIKMSSKMRGGFDL